MKSIHVLLGVLAIAGCDRVDGQGAAVRDTTIPVRVAPVIIDSLAPVIEVPGVLEPKDRAELSFKIGGVIANVLVSEGDEVRRGQPLATLDLSEIDAQVGKAKSALDKAERDLARARNLYRDSVATLEQVQNATTGAEVARSDWEAARFNQRHAVIVAPTDGVILSRGAKAGELVASGRTILTFGSRVGGSIVRIGLVDRDVVNVHAGDAAEIVFDAYPSQTFGGRVERIGAAAHAQTGTYAVEIALRNAPTRVTGLIGRVRLQPASKRSALLVPIDAITEADGAQAVVYTLSPDGTAERHTVTIGAIIGERVAVLSGLDSGARVITAGAPYLNHGSKVRVVQ